MEPKDYLAAMRAGWKQICACVVVALVLGAALAFLQSRSQEPTYTAKRAIFVTSPAPESGAEAPVVSYAEVTRGTLMSETASGEVGYAVEPGSVVVTVMTARVMDIAVTSTSRERADEIADAYVEVLPEVIGQVDDVDEPVELAVITSTPGEVVAVGGGRRILLLAAILGLGAGLAWAFARHAARVGRDGRA